MSGALAVPDAEAPAPGLEYQRGLSDQGPTVVRCGVGILLGISSYLLLAGIVSQLVVVLGWLAVGRPLPLPLYLKESLAFLHPIGLFGTNLGLAMLVPISLVLLRLLHRRRAAWACSVQPGMRWRYLLLCLVMASVVLNAGLWLGQRMGEQWHLDPQRQLWLWLGIVLLTSPLQAAGEEFFFRGYLLQAFGAMPGSDGAAARWFGVVASALVFALFHGVQNPALFCDRFGFGLLAGALVVFTGGLEAGIACHVANNLFAFGWAALGGGIAQARALQAITWRAAAGDLLGFSVFAALAWWIGRRMNLATRTPDPDLARSAGVR